MYRNNGSQLVSNLNPLHINTSQHRSDPQSSTDALQCAASRARQSAEQSNAVRNEDNVRRAASRRAQHSGNEHIGRNYRLVRHGHHLHITLAACQKHVIVVVPSIGHRKPLQRWPASCYMACIVVRVPYSCHHCKPLHLCLTACYKAIPLCPELFSSKRGSTMQLFRWPPQVRTLLMHLIQSYIVLWHSELA